MLILEVVLICMEKCHGERSRTVTPFGYAQEDNTLSYFRYFILILSTIINEDRCQYIIA